MTGFVLYDEYYENPVFSEDLEKNLIMWHTYEREYEMIQELAELESKYENWVVDSCCSDYDGPNYSGLTARIDEIYKERAALLDGTNVTWEEYELAKKNLC
jgi:hypothetical protein